MKCTAYSVTHLIHNTPRVEHVAVDRFVPRLFRISRLSLEKSMKSLHIKVTTVTGARAEFIGVTYVSLHFHLIFH